jgi:hypothetical protein
MTAKEKAVLRSKQLLLARQEPFGALLGAIAGAFGFVAGRYADCARLPTTPGV